jgi:type II secretory pathway pseudopilin PulG
MRARRDSGETLIEILLTIVIVGLTITALISSLATAGNAGNVQRISVETDVVMRNYAEATKAAAQHCVAGANYTVNYTEPLGFDVETLPADKKDVCPLVGSTQKLTLTVIGPTELEATMDIKVRTP